MKRFWSWFIPFILVVCLFLYLMIAKYNSTVKIEDKLESPIIVGEYNNRVVYSIYNINGNMNALLNKSMNNKYFKDAMNDGGSSIYYVDNLFDKHFYVLSCNKLNGNNNIYILEEINTSYCEE